MTDEVVVHVSLDDAGCIVAELWILQFNLAVSVRQSGERTDEWAQMAKDRGQISRIASLVETAVDSARK